MFSNLEFFIIEALRSFRRGALMNLVAIVTITVTLVMCGLFALLVVNLGNIIGTVSSRLDLAAFVEKNISLEEAGALQIKLAKISGVEKVEFVSRTESWRKFKQDFGTKLNLNEIITGNPLPHTFNLKVRTPELLPKVAKRVSAIGLVAEVRYSGKFIDQIKALVDAVRVGGAGLLVLISFASLLIVVNTVRLTVLSRETDIYIMKLVGATNTFVKCPFIIEGILIGILGGVSSFLILKFSYDMVILRILTALPFLPIVNDQKLLSIIYVAMAAGGAFLGMFGSYISVSKVLKSEV